MKFTYDEIGFHNIKIKTEQDKETKTKDFYLFHDQIHLHRNFRYLFYFLKFSVSRRIGIGFRIWLKKIFSNFAKEFPK